MNHPHFCSNECAAAGQMCGLCVSQWQHRSNEAKRKNGKPTLTYRPFEAIASLKIK